MTIVISANLRKIIFLVISGEIFEAKCAADWTERKSSFLLTSVQSLQ